MRWIRTALLMALASCDVTGLMNEPRPPEPTRAARPAGNLTAVRSPSPGPRHTPRDNDLPPIAEPVPAEPVTRSLSRVATGDLCVTKGELADRAIEVPTFRAVASGRGGDAAAMKFVVHGATDKTRALASGQQRRQLGLKLRAQDGCNLVYVMWRLDPKPKLDVSVKYNPGERTAKECGAHGYTKVKSKLKKIELPTLDDGTEHELRAEIRGDELLAWIDERVVYQGRLPATARGLQGPAGVRSDNLAFELLGLEVDGASASDVTAKCVGDEESD